MDPSGLFLAGLLDSTSRAIAAGVLQRTSGDPPAYSEEHARDVQARLAHLGEALAVGEPRLFVEHVAWLRDAYRARGLSVEPLRAQLRALAQELEESLPTSSGALTRAPLDGALQLVDSDSDEHADRDDGLDPAVPQAALRQAFTLAVLEGRDGEAVSMLLDEADRGLAIGVLLAEVIAPVLAELGRMWQRGEIQVAEEHLASAIARDAAAALRRRIPPPAADAPRVVVASVQGNQHDFGARVVADHFLLGGWNALFLGADMPAEDVVWSARTFGARLLALSVTLTLQLRATASLVALMREGLPDVPILVGGGPFRSHPELWRSVGASGSAPDARSAVERAAALAGIAP